MTSQDYQHFPFFSYVLFHHVAARAPLVVALTYMDEVEIVSTTDGGSGTASSSTPATDPAGVASDVCSSAAINSDMKK